jgi:hypothetical protein
MTFHLLLGKNFGDFKTDAESVSVTDNTKHPFRLEIQTTEFLTEVTSTNTMSYLQSTDHSRSGHFKAYS